MNNTNQRGAELAAIAATILVDNEVDITQPIPVSTLADKMQAASGCDRNTAKRHVVKAARVARGEHLPTRGGARPGSGWRKGRSRKKVAPNVGQTN